MRSDTLHRHELSHHTAGGQGGKDRAHRITVKTFRACYGCATARVRCSGGTPCGRCDTRSLECQYPTERRSKGKIRMGASKEFSGTEMHENGVQTPVSSSNQANGDDEEPILIEHSPSKQMGRVSKNETNGISSPKGRHECSSRAETLTESTSSNGRASIMGASNFSLYLASHSVPPERLPLETYSGEIQQSHNEMTTSHMPKMFSVDPTPGLGPNMRNLQPDMMGAEVDMEMDMSGSGEINLEFDPSLFDQSMLSTINWLPNEFFTNASHESPQLSGVPFAATSTYSFRFMCNPHAMASALSPSMAENLPHTPSERISLGTDMRSPRQYSHVGSEVSPHSESVDSAKRSSDYYVDGGGARLPRYRKKQASWSAPAADAAGLAGRSAARDDIRRHEFPGNHAINLDRISEAARSVRPIDTNTHHELYRNFLRLCRTDNPFFEMFETDNFPTEEECSHYLACYFDVLHDVYPIVHLPTFDPNRCHWLLVLAIVAIGSHTSDTQEKDQCRDAFHEMIRRAIYTEKEKAPNGPFLLDFMQAILLNCIGLLHSGNEQDKLSALTLFKGLVTFANYEKLLRPSHTEITRVSKEATWVKWAQEEARRRTGYCIWLLDCTLAYSFEDRPLLSLDDGQAALPAHEKLWQTGSAEEWKQLWDNSSVNESLYDTVHILYIEKRLVSGIGEFSHILLIHALYHRMWEVGDYFRRPLSFWNPTAKKQSRETAIPTGSVWLPGIPSYSKWRNSACDCLDILHWTANSTIAKAAGMEHPTVLHLHVARLVLLTPFREIRSLATSVATDQMQWSKRHQAIEWQYIWRWVKHDQYKARLSIIHAGVTLWHVRRYSTNAFHEPVAAFLAVLTLWAYGSCHAPRTHDSSPNMHMSGREPLQEPSFIHLDRPCDDELVQLFVREGHSMRGNITGVGDICGPEGPEKILRVGCETLCSLTAWGISKRFVAILTRLADVMAQRRGAEHIRNASVGS
ncbi:uncharacterized protein N7477_003626 [Penicillium maclennaniae]|uniref:uncharacterized protein n=1 Tax=Penicillium maclennaniae TaxID=1343394 RepID=UPI0025407211|nr:uncharacterized protein N7477_003626 [Penicillium maclennaniae]KAJ5677993.1 hypothetical protein N7477_003626 [Penicillium maclennaniae]